MSPAKAPRWLAMFRHKGGGSGTVVRSIRAHRASTTLSPFDLLAAFQVVPSGSQNRLPREIFLAAHHSSGRYAAQWCCCSDNSMASVTSDRMSSKDAGTDQAETRNQRGQDKRLSAILSRGGSHNKASARGSGELMMTETFSVMNKRSVL